ncbi:hypothetical protein LEMLEM_LOCUS27700, partial [Lemmus lemmus]
MNLMEAGRSTKNVGGIIGWSSRLNMKEKASWSISLRCRILGSFSSTVSALPVRCHPSCHGDKGLNLLTVSQPQLN